MADSYDIRDGKVIPYSGGRMHTDTNAWRDATDMEIEQQAKIAALENALEAILDANEEGIIPYGELESARALIGT